MVKKLPVGVERFEEFLTEDFYYVDKTMFIAELLQNWGKVNLFTRPRRFGKTLTMSMLKAFLSMDCDKTLFDGLKISQEKELCEEYMGRFPVIWITLKSVDGSSYQKACDALRPVIGMAAMQFQFLEESGRLTNNEKNMYHALVNVDKSGTFTMTETVMLTSLNVLSLLLAKHYGCKIIILIDEYDVPLDKAFQAGYYDEMVTLLRNMFSNALKTNDNLYFAVLTGCLRISKESIFTGLNNLNVMTITDEYFNNSFGFTDNEVKDFLAYYGLEDKIKTMSDWYDGYQFGGVSVYSPWDVIKYAQALRMNKNAEPQNYWANTSGNDMVRRFIYKANQRTRDEIEDLMEGKSILKEVRQELTYRELDDSIDNLWSVLLMTGYLTVKERVSAKKYRLAIPNAEIRDLFFIHISEWFKEKVRKNPDELEYFCDAIIAGDSEAVQRMLTTYLRKTISVRDYNAKDGKKENFYHGILLGLFSYPADWSVQSNIESGLGYCDIIIKDKMSDIGIIIEIKYADKGKLDTACKKALHQIETRNYETELLADGMQKIIKYGMAFYSKQCMVVKACE